MKLKYSIATLIILLICECGLFAQKTGRNEPISQVANEPIVLGQRITFHSDILKEDRTMNIYLPETFGEASDDHEYPVIVIAGPHGDKFFSTISGIVQHMSYVGRMPESIVISYHDTKWYAPDVYTNGMWSRDQLVFDADPELYIKHLKEEFFPYLKKNFRAADYRMIMGVSGSSVFPLHTFAKAPDLFQAHITVASADMIGMGYKPGETFIDAFEQVLVQNPDQQAQLYVGVAEDDMEPDEPYQENMDELEKRLAPYQPRNLKLKVEVIPDEGHYDSVIKAFLSAIEMIFPKEKWSPKYREMISKPGDALANIDDYYQKLSNEYGFSVIPRAERWNNVNCLSFIGRRLLQDGRVKEGITVLERLLKYRPKSEEALNRLMTAYKENGQQAKADLLKSQSKGKH